MKPLQYVIVPLVAVIIIFAGLIDVSTTTQNKQILASQVFSLEKRYAHESINQVFADNILLTLAYTRGEKIDARAINWDKVRTPFNFNFTLEPGRSFAFHDGVFPEYKSKVDYSTGAHFNGQEGFKSDGYLMGDGVCHLASLMYWAAYEAGLDTKAPVSHDFAPIPEVPQEFGVSIYSIPGDASSAHQNLYITNNKKSPIIFSFDFDGANLRVSIAQPGKVKGNGLAHLQ